MRRSTDLRLGQHGIVEMRCLVAATILLILATIGCVTHQVDMKPVHPTLYNIPESLPAGRTLLAFDGSIDEARGVFSTGVADCGGFRFPLNVADAFREALLSGTQSMFGKVEVPSKPFTREELSGYRCAILVRLKRFDVHFERDRTALGGSHFRPVVDLEVSYSYYNSAGIRLMTSEAVAERKVDAAGSFCGSLGDALGEASARAVRSVVEEILQSQPAALK